jgi:putative salt-induced outer membrane protein YdiY
MHARDRAAIDRLLAPDYVLRSVPDVDRGTWIGNAMTLCWGDRSDIDGFRARVQEAVVVASFELTFYVDPLSCQRAVLKSLITDVWIRRPEGWRLLVRHAGPPPSGTHIGAQYGMVPQPPPIWEATGDVSVVGTGGNASTLTLGVAGQALHRAARHTTTVSAAFVSTEAEGETKAESLSAQARHGADVGPRTQLFGRAAYARDRFAGIANRVVLEAGLGHRVERGGHALTAEGSAGFTVEQRLDATRLDFASATGTLHYGWRLAPSTQFTESIGLTADLERGRNWRGTSTTAVTVTITQLLAIKASHALEYRHAPVAGFGRVDTKTAVSVVFAWQRAAPPP